MRGTRRRTALLVLLAVVAAACAPPSGGTAGAPVGCVDADPAPPPIVSGVSYGPDILHVADVYPACEGDPVGTVMFVPGGGYTTHVLGSVRSDNVQRLREQGWVVVLIRYRLAPLNQWNAQGQDVRRAITWWRDTASAGFGADGLPLVGMGWSAGGHLAEWATVRTDGPHFDAGVSVAGGTYWPDRLSAGSTLALFGLSPATSTLLDGSTVPHLDATDPPVLHIHAENDGYVPVAQAHLLAERITTHGDPSRHAVEIDPACGHSITCLTPERIDPFLAALLP